MCCSGDVCRSIWLWAPAAAVQAVLRWAQHHGYDWGQACARLQPEEATWRCCSMPTRTGVPGGQARVRLQPWEATWQCTRTAVPGTQTRAWLQPEEATWQCCIMPTRMAAHRIAARAS